MSGAAQSTAWVVAPGLDPPSRHRKARGQLLERLIGVGKGADAAAPGGRSFPSKSCSISGLMMQMAWPKPARFASYKEKSMRKCPSGSTGVVCLRPPKRLPHSGCHDDQSRFYHGLFLLFSGIARGSCYLHSSPTADGMQGQNKDWKKFYPLPSGVLFPFAAESAIIPLRNCLEGAEKYGNGTSL